MVYSVVIIVTIIPIMSFFKVMVLFLSFLFKCLTNISSCKVVLSWFVLFTTAWAVLCACFSGLQLSSSCVSPCICIFYTWVWSWWLEPGLSSRGSCFGRGLCRSFSVLEVLYVYVSPVCPKQFWWQWFYLGLPLNTYIVSQISSLLSVAILVHSSTARLSLNHSGVLLCTFIFFLYSV